MKLNEIVLKDLFSHAPAGENFRFVFLVENEALEDKILQAGYMAVGISDEPQKAVFLKIIEEFSRKRLSLSLKIFQPSDKTV